MLRNFKLLCLWGAERLGLNNLVLESGWRQQRLLILCYHGIALEDEDRWSPKVYLSQSRFCERLGQIRHLGCNVLPLGRALKQLFDGTLPKRAVAITFDDGGYDFYRLACPLLRTFGFPVTLYLTTYYTLFNRPVFDVMLSYLLWKGQGRRLCLPPYLREPVLLDASGSVTAESEIRSSVQRLGFSGREKDGVLSSVAAALHIDYERLCAKRVLHLMTSGEVHELAAAGIDIQLHTHHHRVPQRRELFLREIEENRQCIQAATGVPPVHFCYPCGFHIKPFEDYLREAGVQSAATCDLGLAGKHSNPLLLPRLLDSSNLTDTEFAGWISGLASLLPRRPYNEYSRELLDRLSPA